MKICKECGIEKEETEFFKKNERWLEGKCKQCKRAKAKFRESLPENKEKEKLRNLERNSTEKRKKWREENRKRNKEKIARQCQKYRDENREHLDQKAKEWREKNRDKFYEWSKKSIQKHPLKRLARKYLEMAIYSKIISRPNKCEKCMKECHPDAHHADYSKPLDVIWLCRQCHGYLHRKIKD